MVKAVNLSGLIVTCLASMWFSSTTISASDLTRASGLVPYPDGRRPEPSYPQEAYLQQNSQQYPSRIRITLTRNISNLNQNQLTEPSISYYGVIGVGSPAKVFNVVFDTGVSATWLPYYNWFPLANNLHYSDGYVCKDSSTCSTRGSNKFSIDYRGTSLSGETYEDLFTLYQDMTKEDALVLVAPQLSFGQNFLAVDTAGDEQFRYKPYDGVVGLAPVSQSTSGIRQPILSLQQEQHRQRQLDGQQQQFQEPPYSMPAYQESGYYRPPSSNSPLVFSFWFNPNQNSRHGGELILGGIDESRFDGDIHYHKVLSWFDWQLQLNRVMLGNNLVSCSNGCLVTLDTGANSFVGPREDVEHIYSELQARYEREANIWIVDCDRIGHYPMLTFIIDENPYSLYPLHYIKMFRYRENNVCYLTIKPWDNQGWLLGTNFIGAYYSIFDFVNRRVGFANPRDR